jgi:hypothetical protein
VKREKAEKKIRKYLYDLHVTLWADFDLHRPDSFEKAVEWFTDQAVRAGLVSDKDPQEEDRPPVEYKHVKGVRTKVGRLSERDPSEQSIPHSPLDDMIIKPLGPLYSKCNDLNCKEGLDEHSHPVEPEPEGPAQCICPMGIDGNGVVVDEHCPIHGHPADLDKSRMDSGFVTYKEAATCTCSYFDSVELAGVGHMIVDPDCPIHSPHAFPWRKSR